MILIIKDFVSGLKHYYVWKALARADISQRYKRTVLGPLWAVVTTGIIILFVGPVYSRLFGQKLEEYFPYIAISYILWNFLSTLIQEISNSLISSSEYIKHVPWPFPVYFYRCILRNLITLCHNLIIIIPVVLYYSLISVKSIGLFFIGLALILFLSIGYAMISGALCLRYRDIPQLITNLLNVLFFITPVFWSVSMLGEQTWMASINPMFHILEIIRQPLLGKSASWLSYITVLIMGFILFFVGLAIYSVNRKKISFWA